MKKTEVCAVDQCLDGATSNFCDWPTFTCSPPRRCILLEMMMLLLPASFLVEVVAKKAINPVTLYTMAVSCNSRC